MKKKPLPLIERVTITDVAAEGNALARVGEMVVFVPWTAPGDVVDIQIRRKKHSYAEGEAVRFHEYSPLREEPFCEHYGICGGCRWQHLRYEEQLRAKQRQVEDQLRRIGKVELPEVSPILGSVKTCAYRNKLDFGASNRRYLTKEEIASGREFQRDALGFHITGAFDKILPIERCHLMDDLHNELRNAIRDYALEHHLTFYDLRQGFGLLRDVILRHAASPADSLRGNENGEKGSGEWMVILQFHFDHTGGLPEAEGLMHHLVERFPQITSLLYVDNQKCNDTIGDLDLTLFHGQDYITEHMEDLQFKVGPKSFYQTNTEQALRLYEVVRRLAYSGIDENERPLVYDLYTGTGTIANFVARRARQVVGIEYVPEAIEDAKVNSRINGIDNTLFFAGDMKDLLTADFIARYSRPDIIITDPPRAGMHPDVVQTIIAAAPGRIVYVSCNPATQARDLALLDAKYRVAVVQPVDMFPHTPHVENVVLLELRK